MGTQVIFGRPCGSEVLSITAQTLRSSIVLELSCDGTTIILEMPYRCDIKQAHKVVEAMRNCYALPIICDETYDDMRVVKMKKEAA